MSERIFMSQCPKRYISWLHNFLANIDEHFEHVSLHVTDRLIFQGLLGRFQYWREQLSPLPIVPVIFPICLHCHQTRYFHPGGKCLFGARRFHPSPTLFVRPERDCFIYNVDLVPRRKKCATTSTPNSTSRAITGL